MSYEIEFSGSTVDRESVAQLTASSLLVKDTSVSLTDSRHEFNTNQTVPFIEHSQSQLFPEGSLLLNAISDYNSGGYGFIGCRGTDFGSAVISGGIIGLAQQQYNPIVTDGITIYFPILRNGASTITLSSRVEMGSNGNIPNTTQLVFAEYDISGNNLAFNNGPNISIGPGYQTISRTASITNPSCHYLLVGFNTFATNDSGTIFTSIDYYRVTTGSTTPVTITPQTITEGVAPVGGSPIVVNTQTLQNGSNSIASPSKLFGLRVNDGATKKLEASYNPSADDNEDSYIDATDAKIITADTTSLSVESFGSGAPEYIERGSSLEVKDVSNLTEN